MVVEAEATEEGATVKKTNVRHRLIKYISLLLIRRFNNLNSFFADKIKR